MHRVVQQVPQAGAGEALAGGAGAEMARADGVTGAWEFPVWDPVLLDLPGPFDLRYYGLMYVVGFFAANWILTKLAEQRFFPVGREQIGDLIFYCIFGVILGGRLGYALFYDQGMLAFPEFFFIFNGGLAFHGGLLGVVVAMLWFARKHRVHPLRVGDCLAIAVTPGIFAVRMANFINGELYGRATTPDTLGAMQFPTDDIALAVMGLARKGLGMRERELAIQLAADVQHHRGDTAWLRERIAELPAEDPAGNPIDWQGLVQSGTLDWANAKAARAADGSYLVPFRHPSQLYEGFGEGLLVGLILLLIYLGIRRRPSRPGLIGGVFLICYGAVRWGIELVRRPDQQFIQQGEENLGEVFLGMTMGQTLCSAMILAGVLMIGASRIQRPLDPAAGEIAGPTMTRHRPQEQGNDQGP